MNRAFWTGFIAQLLILALAAGAWAHDFPVEIDRFVDADTFDGRATIQFPELIVKGRFRLMCINAPESRGRGKSDEGVAMAQAVKNLGIERGQIEVVERDSFARWLVYVRPEGWDITLNRWLYRGGAPLYDGLTRAEKAECLRRLE